LSSTKLPWQEQKALGTADWYKDGNPAQPANLSGWSGWRVAAHRTVALTG